jgi:hypothetical protein
MINIFMTVALFDYTALIRRRAGQEVAKSLEIPRVNEKSWLAVVNRVSSETFAIFIEGSTHQPIALLLVIRPGRRRRLSESRIHAAPIGPWGYFVPGQKNSVNDWFSCLLCSRPAGGQPI